VSCSLVGRSLRWQMSLDPQARSSWDAFQQALFLKYPSPEDEDEIGAAAAAPASASISSKSSSIPTPAAAPSSTTSSGLKLLCDTDIPWVGYLKVRVSADPSLGDYVSRTVDQHGVFLTTKDQTNALQVKFSPQSDPHLIELLNSPTGNRWLCGAPGWGYKIGDRMDSWVGLGAMALSAPGQGAPPESKAMIWNVNPIDGVIRVTWPVYATYVLTPVIRASSRRILLVTSYDVYTATYKDIRYCMAELIFEPC